MLALSSASLKVCYLLVFNMQNNYNLKASFSLKINTFAGYLC